MPEHARREYFNELSGRWDGFTDGDRVRQALHAGLSGYAIGSDEHVIDLGCGTGNLTRVLAAMLGPQGRITAVDYSSAMVAVASGKITDARVRWVVADAAMLPVDDGCAERVICFSAWPHFPDPHAVGRELFRVLRPEGSLHILHIDSREKINAIHTGVGGPLAADLLPPVDMLAAILVSCGFTVHEAVETDRAYRLSARRSG